MRIQRILSALNFATPTDARKTVAKVKRFLSHMRGRFKYLLLVSKEPKLWVKMKWQSIFKKGKETLKKQKGEKLAKKAVEAPKGFHWI